MLARKFFKQVNATGNFNLYAWGLNTDGQIGIGNNINQSSPVLVGSFASASFSTHALAVRANGTLWAWGSGLSGQLGDGTIVSKSSPTQIGALSDWSKVSAGSSAVNNFHSLAVKTDGTLWAWGSGLLGRLGDGTVVSKSSPIQIGALNNWSMVSAGGSFSLAVKTNGTLWAWGEGASGRLGDNTTISKSSPVQIGALSDWAQVDAAINHSLAVKTNGTLWAWGLNTDGRLGDGTVTNKSSPVQIGALSSWKTSPFTTIAVSTSGAFQ